MIKIKFVNKKKIIFSFMFFMFGMLVALCSPLVNATFETKLLDMISNRWFIIMSFLSISLFISDYCELSSNVNLVLRSKDLKTHIKGNVLYIIKIITIYMLISLFLMCVSAYIVSDFQVDFGVHLFYSIPMWSYIIIHFFRIWILYIVLSVLVYFIDWKFGNIPFCIICFLFLVLMLFGIDFYNVIIIDNIFDIPILVTSYFKVIEFSSLKLEIFASLFQILIYLLIDIILFKKFFVENQREKLR